MLYEIKKFPNKLVLSANLFQRFQATSSKHSQPEVTVGKLLPMPICLKAKGKVWLIFFFKYVSYYHFHIKQ